MCETKLSAVINHLHRQNDPPPPRKLLWPVTWPTLPRPGGIVTQARDDAWILNQIKTVRSDMSGRQLSWPCWINEALASFRMPGFWMTRLISVDFLEPTSVPSSGQQKPQALKLHPMQTHSSLKLKDWSVFRLTLLMTLSSHRGVELFSREVWGF